MCSLSSESQSTVSEGGTIYRINKLRDRKAEKAVKSLLGARSDVIPLRVT